MLASNTNELHAARFRDQFADVLAPLRRTGRCRTRPGPASRTGEFFEHCQRLAGCPPHECLFIDDLPANVEGARRFGWKAVSLHAPCPDLATTTPRSPASRPDRPDDSAGEPHAMSILERQDPDVWQAIQGERRRQQDGLEMIASENYTSPAVMAAQGSVLTNKYAEGYPGRRYYGGCEFVDVAERLAIDRVAASCSAPSTPTSSRTPGPRPTWPSTSPASSRATPSWRWTWPTAAT